MRSVKFVGAVPTFSAYSWAYYITTLRTRCKKTCSGWGSSRNDSNGERLVGFDNAHPVAGSAGPGGKKDREHDHRHRQRTVRPYVYEDAGKLLADFWAEVDAVLKERGVIR